MNEYENNVCVQKIYSNDIGRRGLPAAQKLSASPAHWSTSTSTKEGVLLTAEKAFPRNFSGGVGALEASISCSVFFAFFQAYSWAVLVPYGLQASSGSHRQYPGSPFVGSPPNNS